MFRFPSFLLTFAMKRLLLFLVFVATGATNPVEDFDEWDFQRRQDTLGIVNGSHSISGAAFIPEPPVVLVKALKTLWTYIPFPEIPQLDPKPLNQILDQALFELNDLDLRMFQYECADTHLFSYCCLFIAYVIYLKSKLLEAITVRMPADVERRKLPTLKRSLQENVEMLNETNRGVLEEIKDYVEKAECVARHVQDRHRNTLIIAASLQNLTIQYRRLVNDVNQQRISLANMASLMQDAMASLVHGYLPIALIPPTILSKILDTLR